VKLRKLVTMRDALASDGYFGRLLDGDSWRSWRVLLIAIVGEELRETRLSEVEPSDVEILSAVARLTEMIGSGVEPRLNASIAPAPSRSRDEMLRAAAAANQATNVLNIPDPS
jgi:hypothetical protein